MSNLHHTCFAAALLTCLAWVGPVYAELNAHLKVKGAKQGEIRGGATQKGRENTIVVFAVDHELVSPRDAATGQATGRRQHKPLVITKEVDRSSTGLRNAFISNENLPDVTLQFYRNDGSGAEVQYLTIALKNAHITKIRHIMPNIKDPLLRNLNAFEEVSFVYEEIVWTWNDGGLTAQDSVRGGALR